MQYNAADFWMNVFPRWLVFPATLLNRGLLSALTVAVGLSSVRAAIPSPGANATDPPQSYLVILEGEPSAEVHLRFKKSHPANEVALAVRKREEAINAQHQALAAQIHARGGVISGRFSRLINALRVHVPPARLREIRALPGVIRVEPSPRRELHLATSVPVIGGPQVWGGTGSAADGSGVRIGIIDTGIDYTHADFGGPGTVTAYTGNDSSVIEPGTFPTAKVVGGYDFVGDAYNGSNFPQPDPDPLDCYGHGTHVAGIAAGVGVTTNLLPYDGPYTNTMDYKQFRIGPGVAPRALLYALKVFGCSGGTEAHVDAMEWAATAGTSEFSNHLDVVNLSLGSSFGLTGSTAENDVVNRLADLGCVVAISAGNSGNTFCIVGSPGTADKSICVANSVTGTAIEALSPSSVARAYTAVEASFTLPLAQAGSIQGQLVHVSPNDACGALANPSELNGKIALIDRGICVFVDKVQRAQDAGALAVIMVNNVPGEPITMGGTATGPVSIPGVMISQADGELLKAHVNENITLRLGPDVLAAHPEIGDRLAPSSSRGPAAPINVLKPEIAAPGTSIYSARARGGTDGVALTGTSMAAPHIAGAAALLRQLHPDWTAEDIKAALMNTARPTRDSTGNIYPESMAGAGRVQISDAARLAVTATAQNSGGLVTLNFGALAIAGVYTQTQNVVLQNHSATQAVFTVAISNTVTETGCVFTPLATSVIVPPHSNAVVPVVLSANPALFDRSPDPDTPATVGGASRQLPYETSGEIWFLNPQLSLHVPYYANVRAASALQGIANELALPDTIGSVEVSLPIRGSSAHPQPLASAFQLGATNASQNFTNPALAAVDLLAVGAATDAGSLAEFTNSTLYFGVAVAGNWVAPSPFFAEVIVELDTNLDGNADFKLINSTAGNGSASALFNPDRGNDVFMSILTDSSMGFLSTQGYLNVFPANSRDTAPFNNAVMVLPVGVGALGLASGNSRINYRVLSSGPYSSSITDQTDWIAFDTAQPVIDTTAHGLSTKPFFTDGAPVAIRVNKGAAAANDLSPTGTAGLLLLHHFNVPGQQVEIVNFPLDPNDTSAPLKILPPSPSGRTLTWTSLPGKLYTIEFSTNLAAGFFFQAATNVPSTPPFTSFTDTNVHESTALFYRIKQQ